MEITINQEPIQEHLLNQSLFIVGQAGAGKTEYLKSLIRANASQDETLRIGIISTDSEIIEYKAMNTISNLSFHSIKEEIITSGERDLKSFVQFIQELDIIVVDEGAITIGNGEDLHRFMDLCQNKVVIAAYQTLDNISPSQTYLESILSRFDTSVFFSSRYSFSTAFVLGEQVAEKVSQLPRGSAVVIANSVKA